MLQLETVFLAIAVSFDGFGVGMACGVRRLFITPSSLLVICLMSSGAVATSMFMGRFLGVFIPLEVAPRGGGVILLLLGLYYTYSTFCELIGTKNKNTKKATNRQKREKTGSMTSWSRLTKVPQEADKDSSGTLSARETLGLGTALAADAFGAGFGAVLVGLNPFVTVLAVGLTKLLLVPIGYFLGKWVSFGILGDLAPIISGLILIFLGLSALF